ncbi:MAG TPA: flagellar motor switch protein FliN [Treponema sp.]|jgi:flagellar motor switch protein FliN/FliY|nr:flagellar motor switch protein FliN [Treponema sp.]HBB42580.1 flagellar motor switch protein FliN [Treponema sp.]HCA20470.1 flagellar motor switch protein FliN [Treponema sp.]
MSEGSISQEEIDALLSGVDMGGLGSAGSPSASAGSHIDTATLQKFADGLKDKLAANIGTMTGAEVKVDAPVVESSSRDQLLAKVPEMVVAVMADFNAGLNGDHLFILAPEFAQKIASLVNKEENSELDDMALSVVSEMVSSHSGSEITDLSQGGRIPGLSANPAEAVSQPKAMVRMPQGAFALFTYPLTLDGVPYTLWEAVGGNVADGMATALGGGVHQSAPQPQQAAPQFNQQPVMGGMPNMGAMQGMSQPMNAVPNMGMMPPQMGMTNTPNVQSLQFPNLQQYGGGTTEQGNIGLIMDVFMEMTVELGRTKKTIKDILGMGEGTIIELDKLAGEPVDILVNHKPIAKGEVVVIDENFGVRVTEILPAIEHVTSQM